MGAKKGFSVHAQADSAVLRSLRPSSGRAYECSPSAQVKTAAAHVQTLKRNERKKKVESDFSGSRAQLLLVQSRIDTSKKLKIQNSSRQYALKAERLKGQ